MRKHLYDVFLITFGVFVVSLSLNLLLIPNKLSCGGISSVGTVLFYLYRIPLSLTNIAANFLLFLLGYKYIGKRAVVKTVLGILLFSLFLELTKNIGAILGDKMLVSVFGGALMGVGIGLVIRSGASTGGSDFAGMILHRALPHISVATIILMIDGLVVVLTGIVFGDASIMLYSLVVLFIASKATLFVLNFGNFTREILVVCEHPNAVACEIMHEFHRGVTGVYSRGMYGNEDRMMLLCVVTPKEVPIIVRMIRDLDPKAFVVVRDTRTVLGEGFHTHDG